MLRKPRLLIPIRDDKSLLRFVYPLNWRALQDDICGRRTLPCAICIKELPRDCPGVIRKGDKLQVVKGNDFAQRLNEHVSRSVTITACANGVGRTQQRLIARVLL